MITYGKLSSWIGGRTSIPRGIIINNLIIIIIRLIGAEDFHDIGMEFLINGVRVHNGGGCTLYAGQYCEPASFLRTLVPGILLLIIINQNIIISQFI